MDKTNLDLEENKTESLLFYQALCNNSMLIKGLKLEVDDFAESVHNATAVQCTTHLIRLDSGSVAEGTNITSDDYVTAPRYISDQDEMFVLCEVRVIDEGDTVPHRFDNHVYLRAERGEHTTDGFRKLRIIHFPDGYIKNIYDWVNMINMSVEHGYLSSSNFLAVSIREPMQTSCKYGSIQTGFGTQGPSVIIEEDGSPRDYIKCFYVKTWPKEADCWFTRQTHWPDKKLKSRIRKTGHLLVPTGNRKSQESDLEWRCSFSIAEKILFRSLTNFQRCTFFMLKVLLKEYLPSHINTDGEKQLLSTYHIKTVFLWCLEDSQVKWEPEHMMSNIAHMFDELLRLIHQHNFPHYFMPSINLLDGGRLHGRQKSLISSLSAIRDDLSQKIKKSRFFISQLIKTLCFHIDDRLFFWNIYYVVMRSVNRRVQTAMQKNVIRKLILTGLNESHLPFYIEGLLSITPYLDPQAQHFYRAMYSYPVHDKLLMETVPGLIDQYRSSLLLAYYCMAARDGRELPEGLIILEMLLKNKLHLDPCSGHVKLACFYIATGYFAKAMDSLHTAENNFLLSHKNMMSSALPTEVYTYYNAIPNEVFQKCIERQLACDIVLTWPEYTTVPDLLQFELIHEHIQHFNDYNAAIVASFDFFHEYPPLSLIRLLKFVCDLYSGRSSANHMENLVSDLIDSGQPAVFSRVNKIHTVFNMAAWCYIKMKKYTSATRMMTKAIENRPQIKIMKECAFSHHFSAYVIGQCLATGSRVLVYKRDNVWQQEPESWFTRETMSGHRSPGLQKRQCLSSRVLVYKRDNVWPQESWFTRETMSGHSKQMYL